MNAGPVQKGKGPRQPGRVFLFPVLVLAIYGVLFAAAPDKALLALESSGRVLRNIALPLGLVFAVMLVLNLFVKPAQITKFTCGTSNDGVYHELIPFLTTFNMFT